MIVNIYFPGKESDMLDELRRISEHRRRSMSFLIREALERYLQDLKQQSATTPWKGADHVGQKEG